MITNQTPKSNSLGKVSRSRVVGGGGEMLDLQNILIIDTISVFVSRITLNFRQRFPNKYIYTLLCKDSISKCVCVYV